MKKQTRINAYKTKKQQQKVNPHPEIFIDRGDMDIRLFDLVMKMLYENSDKNILHLESEILEPFNIRLPQKENERIWDVLLSSGFISPVVGFGNAGKIELTRTGYQIMSQYGAYSKFLEVSNAANNPQHQPIIIQMDQKRMESPVSNPELPANPEGPNLDSGVAG